MRSLLLRTSALVLLAGSAIAQDAPKLTAVSDISKAPSGHYALEKNHASITFKVLHMGYAYYTMRFDNFDADLDLDSAHPENSKLKVTIKPSSLDSNNPQLTEHANSKEFLDSAQYPTITFVSTGITKTGPTTGKITGNLTMHGVTKPLVLDATFNGGSTHVMFKQYDVGFSATTTVKRSDFGVSGYIPLVGDDVKTMIEVEFIKADAPLSGDTDKAAPAKQ